jgi:hypothetical protein
MQIRASLAGSLLALALVLGACTGGAVPPTVPPGRAILDEASPEPPPPDSTERGGGPLGSGN